MTSLLEWKEKLIRFYGKNEVYVVPGIKFILAAVVFLLINLNMGYMTKLAGIPVALVLALLCAVLPVNAMIFFAAVLTLLHLYALSIEVCAVGLVLILIVLLLYFRFAPKDSYYAVLTPITFCFHIPYIMPVTAGLLRKPTSMASVISGTVFFYFLSGVKNNATLLSGVEEGDSATSTMVVALNQLLGNKEMYLVLATFVLMTMIVYVVRRMSIDHAWTIAIVAGILTEFTILLSGFLLLGIKGKIIWLIVGNVVAIIIALIQQFLFFNLDYTRTERVQFEDDEYYYYVKAVPKIYMAVKDKQIKKIAGKDDKKDRERISRKALAEEMDIDEDLLK